MFRERLLTRRLTNFVLLTLLTFEYVLFSVSCIYFRSYALKADFFFPFRFGSLLLCNLTDVRYLDAQGTPVLAAGSVPDDGVRDGLPGVSLRLASGMYSIKHGKLRVFYTHQRFAGLCRPS